MKQIKNFDSFFKILKNYISDSNKSYIKRDEVNNNSVNRQLANCDNNSVYGINLRTVGKSFLLYDSLNLNSDEPRKFFIQKLTNTGSYSLTSLIIKDHALQIIKTSIFNLTDTKYMIVLSNASYTYLNEMMSNNCVINCHWYRDLVEKTLYLRGFSVQKSVIQENIKLDHYNTIECEVRKFEEVLLKQLTNVTTMSKNEPMKTKKCKSSHTSKDNDSYIEEFSFSIFKVQDILLAVLVPKYTNENKCLVNVWPIVPISSIYNEIKFINNLKIGNKAKLVFKKLSNINFDIGIHKISNLRYEIQKGISFPQMIRSKINLNQIYTAYFLEYLEEGVHYIFASPLSDCASYLSCTHCNIIFDTLFGFVRHCWEILNQAIFRCHFCDARSFNLSQLGLHYYEKHFDDKYDLMIENCITRNPESFTDKCQRMFIEKRLKSTGVSYFDDYIPCKRPKSAVTYVDIKPIQYRKPMLNPSFCYTKSLMPCGDPNYSFTNTSANIYPEPYENDTEEEEINEKNDVNAIDNDKFYKKIIRKPDFNMELMEFTYSYQIRSNRKTKTLEREMMKFKREVKKKRIEDNLMFKCADPSKSRNKIFHEIHKTITSTNFTGGRVRPSSIIRRNFKDF